MVKKPSELGGIYFKTLDERDEYIRLLLDKSQRVLEGQELALVFDLLLLHPDANNKIGTGVKQIEVKPSRQRTDYNCFWVVREDGTIDDFSYQKCKYNLDRLIVKRRESAYREAVVNQTWEYRFVQTNSKQVCEICGASQGLQVDHDQPLFSTLINDFEKNRTDIPKEFEDATGTYLSKRFCEKDSEYQKSWQQYHQQHAVLRLLCKKHNLTRKRKEES
ncbi:DCL family protein [Nostoc sp. FACHB-152]|uniref:DCL family protein n=1 Tax=unclassified Nostoc TaxID=2593658 RepID=UPI0016843682|nr:MULTISPECIES: DCL family protein [unclassified Nostoc]MBD2450931.1 DCL family protein [Nostoc sp. FACHB-152]MBD2471291.1 DCL family protein [Nostoc sp. FACHB-145]